MSVKLVHVARGGLIASLGLALLSCDQLDSLASQAGSAVEEVEPPSAALGTVELMAQPSTEQLVAWFCPDLLASYLCTPVIGPRPEKSKLRFSFELVFDLGNPNGFPVPTIEMLIALSVFEGRDEAELGALCVSFCDPEAEQCDGGAATAEEACRAPDVNISDLDDYEPSVDDLIEIATGLATGEIVDEIRDNLTYRVIPARAASDCHESVDDCRAGEGEGEATMCCGDDCAALPDGCRVGKNDQGQTCRMCDGAMQARVRLDLGIDAMLKVLEQIADESGDALLSGEWPSFDIPYNVLGTLFFDVPVLGRFAVEFGPLDGTWSLD